MSVPSTIAYIKTSHESYFLVNYAAFFMMGPQLRDNQTWMSENFEVFVLFFKNMPDIVGIIVQKKTRLLKHYDKHFNSSFGGSCQGFIKPGLSILDFLWSF